MKRLLTNKDRESVDSLLEGTQGHLRIGVNMRPIRGQQADRGAISPSFIYEEFLDRFAQGLIQVAKNSSRPVSYVFFPMNPSRIGMSDLASAWSLHRRLANQAHLCVWETDPEVEGVLYLLEQLDAAVAMRLHACIFSLCSGLPVYGIDYYPDQSGKVSQLFADLDQPENACRIDAFDPSRFVERMAWLVRDSEET